MATSAAKTSSGGPLKEFENVFPLLIVELSEVLKGYKFPLASTIFSYVLRLCISNANIDRLGKSLNHNATGGKCNRGMSVIDTYRIIQGKETLSETEYLRAAILGWCTELLQAFFLVAD